MKTHQAQNHHTRKRKKTRSRDSKVLWKQYFENLTKHFEEWSQRYTDLRLTTDIRVASYKGKRLKVPQEGKQWWFRDALISETDQLPLSPKLIILGDPGGGKTTACQHASWELAKIGLSKLRRPNEKPLIPVYFELNSYRANDPFLEDLTPHQSMLTFLAREVERVLSRTNKESRFGWQDLEKHIASERFSFFFDGLNEVGTYHRERLIIDIMAFIDMYEGHGHQFTITMRKMDYEYDLAPFFPSGQFDILEILELDGAAVSEFVMRYYGQLSTAYELIKLIPTNKRGKAKQALDSLKSGHGRDETDLLKLGEAFLRLPQKRQTEGKEVLSNLVQAANLLATLRQPDYERVLWLAQNPSTLKDVVDVYRYEQSIPKSRVRLFERAILARMYTQMAKSDESQPRYSEEVRLAAMQSIAFQMIDHREGLSLPREQVLNKISVVLEKNSGKSKQANNLLHQLLFTDAFLVERVPGEYSFIKQPYQEYFVARELRDRWQHIVTHEKKDPLKDKQLRPFFHNHQYFQFSASMAGLLDLDTVTSMIERLRQKKQTQRLAALCIRAAEEIPSQNVARFSNWTEKHILRFALIPEDLVNLIFVFVTFAFLAFALFLNTDSGGILAAFSSLAVTAVKYLYPPWSHSILEVVIVTAVLIILAFSIRLIARRFSQIQEDEDFSSVVDTILLILFGIPLGFLIAGLASSSFGVGASFVILMISIGAVLLQVKSLTGSATVRATHKIEDFVINRHLNHYLEILRDMGPAIGSRLTEIQAELLDNQNISSRIKDAIQRTWTVSPRTILQVLNEMDVQERQAEAVETLASAVLNVSVEITFREQAAAALFTILDTTERDGVRLNTIDALIKLAVEQPVAYRAKVVSRLRELVLDDNCSLKVRRRAWKALKNSGEHDLPSYPQELILRSSYFWLSILLILVVLFSLFLILVSF